MSEQIADDWTRQPHDRIQQDTRKFIDAGDARPDGAIIYYALGKEAKDVSLTILDADGKAVGEHFMVTDAPSNKFHTTMEFNSKKNQFLIHNLR